MKILMTLLKQSNLTERDVVFAMKNLAALAKSCGLSQLVLAAAH